MQKIINGIFQILLGLAIWAVTLTGLIAFIAAVVKTVWEQR